MNIFIGCSSSDSIDNIYLDETFKIAKKIKNNNLIVGGINGLMGILIKEFLSSTVVCVKDYFDNIDNRYNKIVFDTVNDRKNAIIDMADVFLFLPGGIGTIDEIFSVIEAKRSKQHNKKIIIYNINHYYDNLVNLFDGMYKDNFSDSANKDLYVITDSLIDCINYIGGVFDE